MLTKQSSWWNTLLAKGALPYRVCVCVPEGFCVKITCIVYLDHFYSSRRRRRCRCCCCSFCCYCFYSWREKLSCWRINHCGNWVSHIKAHAWLNCIQFAHVTIMMMMMMIIFVVYRAETAAYVIVHLPKVKLKLKRKRCRCFLYTYHESSWDRLAGRLRKSMNCKKSVIFSNWKGTHLAQQHYRRLLCWELEVLIDSIGL